jgi:hypothetical protein
MAKLMTDYGAAKPARADNARAREQQKKTERKETARVWGEMGWKESK